MEYTLWYDETATGTEKLPVVYLHSFRGDGEDVWKACRRTGCPPFALVSVNNPGTGFDDELSPWPAEGVWKGQAPYKGLASEHLRWLTEQCIPEVEARIAGTARTPSATTATPVACPAPSATTATPPTGPTPSATTTTLPASLPGGTAPEGNLQRQNRSLQFLPIIAGYSLAGLFALWAAWNSDCFHRMASVSGSMWYPGFREYIRDNAPRTSLERAYFSLGDKESHTRHPLMCQVDACTSDIVEAVRSHCPDTVFQWNPGNHFDRPDYRMARAIAWLLR